MPVPYHKEGCQTHMFLANCPDCHDKVWYFGCTCGSKVFFQTPGPPWLKHADVCPIYSIRELLEAGVSSKQIRGKLETEARLSGQEIPLAILEFLHKMGAPGKTVKRRIMPTVNLLDFNGILKEIHPINFYKRLKISKNDYFDAVLGKFIQEDYVEMIVEEDNSHGHLLLDILELIIPKSEIEDCPPKINMRVIGTLKGEMLIDDVLIWVVIDIDWFDI